MSSTLQDLFDHNRAWAAQMVHEKPTFFTDLLAQQSPKYMWIGCSDSRVPANQITGLAPGEVFVHRNVANVVVPTDLNCLSTIQYAVDMLKVEHLMVVGHYGCGGVLAALNGTRVGLADNWLRHIKDVAARHRSLLEAADPLLRGNLLVELNVIEQVVNVARSTVVQDGPWVLRCMAYLDLNPVRAALVMEPAQYPWSSHRHGVGQSVDRRLTPPAAYWALGNTPFAREAAYAHLVKEGLPTANERAIVDAALHGWALGDPPFLAQLQQRTPRRVSRGRPGRPPSTDPSKTIS